MANKKVTEFEHKVYNRKILRNMVKKAVGNNKIKYAWHQLRAEGRV